MGKPLIFFGGCNFRNSKHLRFCRASNSQCGGQGFDPPLLHHLVSGIYGRRHWRLFSFVANLWTLFRELSLNGHSVLFLQPISSQPVFMRSFLNCSSI